MLYAIMAKKGRCRGTQTGVGKEGTVDRLERTSERGLDRGTVEFDFKVHFPDPRPSLRLFFVLTYVLLKAVALV